MPTINQIIKSENYSLVPLDCFNMVELVSPSHNIKPRVCKWCGKEIEQTTRGKPKQFCDSKCKHQEENFFGLSIGEKHKKNVLSSGECQSYGVIQSTNAIYK